LAVVLQGMFVAASEAATGDTSHYYLGFALSHAHDHMHSHVVTHRHADGIVHQHAIDDDDDALAKHVKQTGFNMALVICVIPCPHMPAICEIAGHKLPIAQAPRLQVVDLDGPRPPPRPPSMA
jgi:ABC-type nickel/cobalt efflux system permease component RcnA